MTTMVEQFALGGGIVTIETGHVAGNANGAVWVSCNETVLLATATANRLQPIAPDAPMPLTVHYQEKLYATGRIPASFTKRQGKRTDAEILVARATDRCIRPLLSPHFRHAVDVIIEVMSINPAVPPCSLAVLAASAALMVSDLPFDGPVASVDLHYDAAGQWHDTPLSRNKRKGKLIVGTSDQGILMLEGKLPLLTEETLLQGIARAQEVCLPALEAQHKLRAQTNAHSEPPEASPLPELPQETQAQLADRYEAEVFRATSFIEQKLARAALKDAFVETLEHPPSYHATVAFEQFEGEMLWQHWQQSQQRIDGRKAEELRTPQSELDRLPRTHGNAIFSRGDTQVAAITTLSSPDDEMLTETLTGMTRKHFFVHYNFPNYAAGKQGRFGIWGRREIGHGHLIERAMRPAIPSRKEFAYTISVIAEVLTANGSSSMASVCAATLSLLSAGVPLKSPIAGIAVGMLANGDEQVLLLDPASQEDSLGEMDCKVCGSRDGITAIQMDLKRPGISLELLGETLALARRGRHQLLDAMATTIDQPRPISRFASRNEHISISTACAKALLGGGGKKLRKLKEQSGAKIIVDTSGSLQVTAPDLSSLRTLKELVAKFEEDLGQQRDGQSADTPSAPKASNKPKSKEHDPPLNVGSLYKGTVTHIKHYGAFIEIQPGAVGLLHISELTYDEVTEHISHYVSQHQEVTVKLIQVDEKGRIGLSLRQVEATSTEKEATTA